MSIESISRSEVELLAIPFEAAQDSGQSLDSWETDVLEHLIVRIHRR